MGKKIRPATLEPSKGHACRQLSGMWAFARQGRGYLGDDPPCMWIVRGRWRVRMVGTVAQHDGFATRLAAPSLCDGRRTQSGCVPIATETRCAFAATKPETNNAAPAAAQMRGRVMAAPPHCDFGCTMLASSDLRRSDDFPRRASSLGGRRGLF